MIIFKDRQQVGVLPVAKPKEDMSVSEWKTVDITHCSTLQTCIREFPKATFGIISSSSTFPGILLCLFGHTMIFYTEINIAYNDNITKGGQGLFSEYIG